MPIKRFQIKYRDEILAKSLEEAQSILLDQLSSDVENGDLEAFSIVCLEKQKTPYEQGEADSYYRRPFTLARGDWTAEQLDEYRAGYEANEQAGDFKEIRPGYSIEEANNG